MNRDNLHTSRVAYPNQSLDAALVAADDQQLLINSVSAYNGSAAPMAIAIGHSVANPGWALLVTENSVESDQSEEIQADVATTVLGTVNGDFFVIKSKSKFGLLSFNVSQAQAGSPVYTYQYMGASGYATLDLINTPAYSATGRQSLLFAPPTDWTADADGFYAVKVTATTAPSTAVQFDALKVCEILVYRDAIPSKGELQVTFEEPKQLLLQAGEEIIPFFAFSSSSNTMEASYQISP